MGDIKIIKQDGGTRIFTLSNGDNVPFDDFKQYMKNKTSVQKTVQKTEKPDRRPKKSDKKKKYTKLDLDNPMQLAEFKHGSTDNN